MKRLADETRHEPTTALLAIEISPGDPQRDIARLCADLTGFDPEELSKIALEAEAVVDGETGPDDVPDAPAHPVSVLGDIWELGNHRVMCGSSTDLEAVLELCGGAVVDMVWTDPPLQRGLRVEGRVDHE